MKHPRLGIEFDETGIVEIPIAENDRFAPEDAERLKALGITHTLSVALFRNGEPVYIKF